MGAFLSLSDDVIAFKMSDPDSLPPPPFRRARYFALTVMARADRRWIDPADILRTLAQPIRRERQSDGRVRYWAYIPRLETYIRVITLADGETVHNVFKDRDFTE
jgi:hypothetical protein